jgi:hypothetical protein
MKLNTNSFKIIFPLLLILTGNVTRSFSQDTKIHFSPPDRTVFYESTKIDQRTTIGKRTHQSDLNIQSENHINKTDKGYAGTSMLINILLYVDDKRVTLPYLTVLTNVTIFFSMDSEGTMLDIKGLENLDEGLRQSVDPELYEFYRAILGAETIKKTILKENREDREYYMLPLGGRIPLTLRDTGEEKVKSHDKDCLRQQAVFDTHIKTFSFDPGAAYQALRRQNGLNPRNIDYSDIAVTGTAERIVDPLTSLEYYEKRDRIIKTTIDAHIDQKIPVTMEEVIESKFDFPDLITQHINGNIIYY